MQKKANINMIIEAEEEERKSKSLVRKVKAEEARFAELVKAGKATLTRTAISQGIAYHYQVIHKNK